MLTKELAAHQIHPNELATTPVALHLTPPVEQYGMLDFRAALPLIEVGYRYAVAALEGADLTALRE
jgi:predicted acylesterase/phospholipase RssA